MKNNKTGGKMRIAANYNKGETRKNQLDILVKTIMIIKKEQDLKLFLESLISGSEMAYIGQRLDIIRMLAKNFNYDKIKSEINASTGTIAHAQQCLDFGAEQFKKMVLACKFKKIEKNTEFVSTDYGNGLVSPKMSGAIRLNKPRKF